jgi:1-acyl-sn-glycerol-3-phosphate acyltransferase
MDRFSDIRPYNDDEIRPVIDNLMANDEFIGNTIGMRFPRLSAPFRVLLRPFIRMLLKKEFSSVDDVRTFQALVKKHVDRLLDKTITDLQVSNLDLLDKGPYLFLCNHRDIALDPTLVNFALIEAGHDSARIAIGDNLLSKPFASDLMRLNKCFIVRRSAKGRKALEAYKTLSAYIGHSILEEKVSIWIAQREGRAKDGNDYTEPAIIKMLAMNRDKHKESFSDYIRKLRIVPVTLSYEYDPCDSLKARELSHIAEHGEYKKGENEDLNSIASGLMGQKGNVHLCYGRPIEGHMDSPEAVASEADRQIITNYHLHKTNFIAFHELYGDSLPLSLPGEEGAFKPHEHQKEIEIFRERINSMPLDSRRHALAIYANPVVSKIKLISSERA